MKENCCEPCCRKTERGRMPINLAKPGEMEAYSGFIIVRLRRDLPASDASDLLKYAAEAKLDGLREVLESLGKPATRRVVRGLKPDQLRELEEVAARTEWKPLHSLTGYWRIDLRGQKEPVDEVLERLNALPAVERAYRELAVSEPVVNAGNDPYNGDQDYLDAAPTGIDARWAWTQANGEGAGVALMDVEQGWMPTHEDLTAKAPTIIFGDNMDGVGAYKGNHGTAVLGEIVGVDNTVGVVGIAPACTSVRMASHYDAGTGTNLHVADAIVAAIPLLSPGDVMLLEIQRNYLPTEVDDADFDAIRLAVAHGIVVVEAAGNGDNDLDAYTSGGDHILQPGHADFRDSGAIMVGAGESALPHNRCWFSNYGGRIDCYAWGENIVTCGYGDLDDGGGDDDEAYTDTFGGTSGASPIIVGAAMIVQGMHKAVAGVRLSPVQMRALLSNPATGTAQGGGVAGDIGVMPDLRDIIQPGLNLTPDVYLRDNVGDNGDLPTVGSISASPDVIVRPDPVADPTASYGEGSGTENSNTLGYVVEAGQDNSIYVRLRNRGDSAANGVVAAVYWAPVATLLTPDLWTHIGDTAAVNVPVGDTLVVAGPVTWHEADIPATGHYCFMALAGCPQDPAPPLPPGPPLFDWNAFYAFVRNHNNVTWRNFNVEDNIPDPAEPAAYPFLLTGTPDRRRRFDLEVVRKLPRDVELGLTVPLALGRRLLKQAQYKVELDRERQELLIHLPPQARVLFRDVELPAGARLPCRLVVRGSRALKEGGGRFGLRQLWRGEEMKEAVEVGAVWWQYARRPKVGRERVVARK
jgi:hypothetical protein